MQITELRIAGFKSFVDPQTVPIEPGLTMVTAFDANDPASHRVRRFRPRFEAAPPPDPETGDWAAWQALMGDRGHDADSGPDGAMTVQMDNGFGTVCSSLVALPSVARPECRPVWLFAAGRPDEAPYQPLNQA